MIKRVGEGGMTMLYLLSAVGDVSVKDTHNNSVLCRFTGEEGVSYTVVCSNIADSGSISYTGTDLSFGMNT